MWKKLFLLLCIVTLLTGCAQKIDQQKQVENREPELLSKEKLEDFGGPYNGSLWNCTSSFKGSVYTSKQIAFTVNGAHYYGYFWDDSLVPSLDWIKENTPSDAKFICWWDYAGMLMGYAGRFAVAYAPSNEILHTVVKWSESEPTIDHEIIMDVSEALTTDNPEVALKVAEKYDADYFYIPKRSLYLLPVILPITGKNVDDYMERVKMVGC